jgi:hypothetical protein
MPGANRTVLEEDVARGAWRDPAGIWRLLNGELWSRVASGLPATAPVA